MTKDVAAELEKIEDEAKGCGGKLSQADMMILLCLQQKPELSVLLPTEGWQAKL